MTQFGASLRFVEFAAVAELLANLGSTGRLRISHGAWVGEILVRRGQMISASLGAETGQASLEGEPGWPLLADPRSRDGLRVPGHPSADRAGRTSSRTTT